MSSKFSQIRNKRSKPPHCKPGPIILTLPEHWTPKSLWCYFFWIDDRVPVDHNQFNKHFFLAGLTPGERYRAKPKFEQLTLYIDVVTFDHWKTITVPVNIKYEGNLIFSHHWDTGPINLFFPIESEKMTYKKLYPPQPWKEVVSHCYFSDPGFPFIPFPD